MTFIEQDNTMHSLVHDVIEQTKEQEKGDYTPVSLDLKTRNGTVPELSPASSRSPSPPPPYTQSRNKRPKKDESPLSLICEWAVEHQIGLSVNLLALLALTHACFPRARPQTRKFFDLSYYNPETGTYTAGWSDACIVFFYMVLFTALRASVMDYILMPLAQWNGIKKKKEIVRFAEQGWLGIYYTISFTIGFYLNYQSDYFFNLRNMWTDWPTRDIIPSLKWYILVQFAFWLQQIMVIQIEKRRKDHLQMFTHHILTCILLFTSYGYHQTKVANVILCLMDFVDIFLPAAKCLKYMGWSKLCDVMFGVFMVTWFFARHIWYNMVVYSVYKHLPQATNYGCYKGAQGSITGPFPAPDRFMHLLEPFMDPAGVVCFNHRIKWGFLICLIFLQCITIMWFCMIVRVAAKVIAGGSSEDTRSDDESDELDEYESLPQECRHECTQLPFEEEVGVEAINLKGRSRRKSPAGNAKRNKKSLGSATGVTLHGHSDRKEILGRIGCERGV